ncbi:MAG: hypothetical protein OXL68_01005 [Paracoccaceae bacterium]|nr:hypothetical protein [Paracoccaceae bacterium]
MTATALRNTLDRNTSALGSMQLSRVSAEIPTELIAIPWLAAATVNTDSQGSMVMWTTIAPHVERTAADPAGQFDFLIASAESTAEAIMEIRRRSGLTWQELGNLFDVSRRSVHHWANGKPVNARHDRTIRRMLAAIRHLDQGSQLDTRAMLLAVNQATGISTFDLLQAGCFDEATGRVADVRLPESQRVPLSRAASDARRPPAPVLLLGAEQDRPDISANARIVRAKRTPRTAG